jgi:hypothetical protein
MMTISMSPALFFVVLIIGAGVIVAWMLHDRDGI